MISKNRISYILYFILFANTSVYSSNIETHFNLREIMKNAEFLCDRDEVVAKWITHKNIDEDDNCIVCYSNDRDTLYYHSNVNIPVTKYDKLYYYFKEIQEDISVLNFKLNNKLELNEIENMLFCNFEQKRYLPIRINKEYLVSHSKYNLSISNDILNRFYNDIREIKSRNSIMNSEGQLKIDIYNQQQDMNKFTTKYDKEFKLMHNYFLNKFYQQSCITGIFKRLRIPKVYKTLFNKFKINTEKSYNNIDDHEKLLDN